MILYNLQHLVPKSQQVQRIEMQSIQSIILPWLKTKIARRESVLLAHNTMTIQNQNHQTPSCGVAV